MMGTKNEAFITFTLSIYLLNIQFIDKTFKKEAYFCSVIDIKKISALVLSAIIFAISLWVHPQGCNHNYGEKNGNSIAKFESTILSGSTKSDPKPIQWQEVKNLDQPTTFEGLRFGHVERGKAYIAASMYNKEILYAATRQSNLLAIIFPFHTFF